MTLPDQPGVRYVPAALWPALLLLCAALVYLPGLGSGLFIDDHANLSGLPRIAADGYAPFVLGGSAGPTGRPLSLLTFALQHESWPGNILAFKVVNLLLHLANGLLVFLLCRTLARQRRDGEEAAMLFALAAAGFWLLHPIHGSTVLYVVQRMTQLSALFVFAGALAFVHGRLQIAAGCRAGWGWISGAVLLGTAAATLCKENGALLPALLLVLDLTLLRSLPAPPVYRRWRALLLVLPALALLAYLGREALRGPELFADRPYTMLQKTLTEAVVLITYLFNLVLPRPSVFGLYHDAFPVARGLLDPPATLGAVVMVAGLAGGGFLLRRRAPVIAAGLLWFFTAHLLESSVLNLHIYFEHRNYLPAFGVALLFAAAVTRLQHAGPTRGAARAALVLPLALLAWITLQNASLWSRPLDLALEFVRARPDSRAALAHLGTRYLASGRIQDAEALYRDAAVRYPDAAYPALRQASIAACVHNTPVPEALWRELEERAGRERGDEFLLWPELDVVLRIMQRGECTGFEPGRLLRLLDILGSNPALGAERGQALQLAANLCLLQRDLPCALQHVRAALAVYRTPERQVQYADILLALGRAPEAAAAIGELQVLLAHRPLLERAHRPRLQELESRLDELRLRSH